MRQQKQNQRWLHQLEQQSSDQTIKQPVIGVDYGFKFCGLAYSPDGIIILAHKVVPTADFKEALKQLMQLKNINHLVFGLPFGLGGKENPLVAKIKSVAAGFNASIDYVDEKYSSSLGAQKTNGSRVDDEAAVQIIQFYWDQRK